MGQEGSRGSTDSETATGEVRDTALEAFVSGVNTKHRRMTTMNYEEHFNFKDCNYIMKIYEA